MKKDGVVFIAAVKLKRVPALSICAKGRGFVFKRRDFKNNKHALSNQAISNAKMAWRWSEKAACGADESMFRIMQHHAWTFVRFMKDVGAYFTAVRKLLRVSRFLLQSLLKEKSKPVLSMEASLWSIKEPMATLPPMLNGPSSYVYDLSFNANDHHSQTMVCKWLTCERAAF